MKLEVECYSGRKVDERPVRFWLASHQYLAEKSLDQRQQPVSVSTLDLEV
jgi:hypothetical protein